MWACPPAGGATSRAVPPRVLGLAGKCESHAAAMVSKTHNDRAGALSSNGNLLTWVTHQPAVGSISLINSLLFVPVCAAIRPSVNKTKGDFI